MHLKFCMHEHFDLIINPFKYKCETSQIFMHPFQKIAMNAKCNSWVVDLNKIQIQRFNLCANGNSSKDVKQFINPFKYKYKALNCYVCFNIH